MELKFILDKARIARGHFEGSCRVRGTLVGTNSSLLSIPTGIREQVPKAESNVVVRVLWHRVAENNRFPIELETELSM